MNSLSASATERVPAGAAPSRSALVSRAVEAAETARAFSHAAQTAVGGLVRRDGKLDPAAVNKHQRLLHGLAWIATLTEAIGQTARWSGGLDETGRLGEGERALIAIGLGEYLGQIVGGIPMSQNEFVRPRELGLEDARRQLEAFRFGGRGSAPRRCAR